MTNNEQKAIMKEQIISAKHYELSEGRCNDDFFKGCKAGKLHAVTEIAVALGIFTKEEVEAIINEAEETFEG